METGQPDEGERKGGKDKQKKIYIVHNRQSCLPM